jgi:XTP/dITP diphosphohydrolase
LSLVTRHSSLTLFLASANPGKLREFRAAATARGIALESVPGIQNLPDCVEDGATFAENARRKALHYSRYVKGPVLADDSGLCVDALGGAPGIHSARFAGPDADDAANNQKLLEELRRVEAAAALYERRSHLALPDAHIGQAAESTAGEPHGAGPTGHAAHYTCVIALAERGCILTITEGRADGFIIDQPRGTGGFGYDPFFFFPPLGKTFAELSPEEKFAVSHRGEAFRKLLDWLQKSSEG